MFAGKQSFLLSVWLLTCVGVLNTWNVTLINYPASLRSDETEIIGWVWMECVWEGEWGQSWAGGCVWVCGGLSWGHWWQCWARSASEACWAPRGPSATLPVIKAPQKPTRRAPGCPNVSRVTSDPVLWSQRVSGEHCCSILWNSHLKSSCSVRLRRELNGGGLLGREKSVSCRSLKGWYSM